MNTPDSNKNIALYNNQPLDSFSDCIISFEYARYNVNANPTGGFAVVFFDNIIDMPRDGGPGQSLGYTPSSIVTDTCRLAGYRGLQGALLGIGFDTEGKFALETDMVNGISLSALKPQPTIVVRGSNTTNFDLLYNLSDNKTLNDIPGLENFTIDQALSANQEPSYRAVRIIVAKQFEEITVQLKQNIEDDTFVNVFQLNLSGVRRRSFKVALTNTADDPTTKFLVRNFNIAGFPGTVQTADLISSCSQTIQLDNYSPDSKLGMGQEFIAVPVGSKLVNYTTDLNQYKLENIVYTGGGIKILGQDSNTLVAKQPGGKEVILLEYLGQKLAKVATVPTPDLAEPASADIYDNTLVVCTQENPDLGTPGGIFIYNFIDTSTNPTLIGTWNLYQTILPRFVLSGQGLGVSVEIDNENLIVGNSNQYVHAFQKNTSNVWDYHSTIFSPISGTTRFGYTMSLDGRDLMIGAPYAMKTSFQDLGQGEVFHYYLSKQTNEWNLIMPIGEFYAINSIAGNFGTSIKLSNNTCIIGSPCEAYLLPGNPYETPNVGRVYVFNKTTDGIFTQGTVLSPVSGVIEKYMFYGQSVNVFNKFISVVAPFTNKFTKSYAFVYNVDCLFDTPPAHQPIPPCAIGIIDRSGYVIDLENFTYMLNLSCLLS